MMTGSPEVTGACGRYLLIGQLNRDQIKDRMENLEISLKASPATSIFLPPARLCLPRVDTEGKSQSFQTHGPAREETFTGKPYQKPKVPCCLWTNTASPLLLLIQFPSPTAMTTASAGPGFDYFPA